MTTAPGYNKIDIINNAYSELRISGITVSALPEENQLALNKLEAMAAEFASGSRGIQVGYNFEHVPELNSPHGLRMEYWQSFQVLLAIRLLTDFGKGVQPDPDLYRKGRSASSFLYSATAIVAQTTYPSRHPIGSGNYRRGVWFRRYFGNQQKASDSVSADYYIYWGDNSKFKENFDAYLTLEGVGSEYIAQVSIISPDYLDTQVVTPPAGTFPTYIEYWVTSENTGMDQRDILAIIDIVIVTSLSRTETRQKTFYLQNTAI